GAGVVWACGAWARGVWAAGVRAGSMAGAATGRVLTWSSSRGVAGAMAEGGAWFSDRVMAELLVDCPPAFWAWVWAWADAAGRATAAAATARRVRDFMVRPSPRKATIARRREPRVTVSGGGHLDPERGALAHGRTHPDGPALQFGQPLGQRQADAVPLDRRPLQTPPTEDLEQQ